MFLKYENLYFNNFLNLSTEPSNFLIQKFNSGFKLTNNEGLFLRIGNQLHTNVYLVSLDENKEVLQFKIDKGLKVDYRNRIFVFGIISGKLAIMKSLNVLYKVEIQILQLDFSFYSCGEKSYFFKKSENEVVKIFRKIKNINIEEKINKLFQIKNDLGRYYSEFCILPLEANKIEVEDYMGYFNYGLSYPLAIFGKNMYEIILRKSEFDFFVMYKNLLDGILFLQNKNICHGNIRSEKIVYQNGKLKIIDFENSFYFSNVPTIKKIFGNLWPTLTNLKLICNQKNITELEALNCDDDECFYDITGFDNYYKRILTKFPNLKEKFFNSLYFGNQSYGNKSGFETYLCNHNLDLICYLKNIDRYQFGILILDFIHNFFRYLNYSKQLKLEKFIEFFIINNIYELKENQIRDHYNFFLDSML